MYNHFHELYIYISRMIFFFKREILKFYAFLCTFSYFMPNLEILWKNPYFMLFFFFMPSGRPVPHFWHKISYKMFLWFLTGNWALSVCSPYQDLTSWAKAKKSLEPFPWKVFVTNRPTDYYFLAPELNWRWELTN